MKRAPKTRKMPSANLDALTGPAANLRALAGDAMTTEALGIVRERIKLTPQKLALLFLRLFNEDEAINQTEESTLRGMRHETLRQAKSRGEFPRQINGVQEPESRLQWHQSQ